MFDKLEKNKSHVHFTGQNKGEGNLKEHQFYNMCMHMGTFP